MTSTELWKVPRVFLYSRNHRLTRERDVLKPIDFADEIFLLSVKGSIPFMERICQRILQALWLCSKGLAVNSTDSMMAGIQCQMGVAIVDAWSRELSHPEFCHIVLDSSHIVRLMWKTKWTDPVIRILSFALRRLSNCCQSVRKIKKQAQYITLFKQTR